MDAPLTDDGLPTEAFLEGYAEPIRAPIHVHPGFKHGVLMADSERRLEGAHPRLTKGRFTTFEPGDDVAEPELLASTRDSARIAALPRDACLTLVLDRE